MKRWKKWQIILPVASVALVGMVGNRPAEAAALTFFGEDLTTVKDEVLDATPNANKARNDFLSYLIGVGVEDLESLAPGSAGPVDLNLGGTTATLTGDGQVKQGADAGAYATSGSQYWSWTGSDATDDNPSEGFTIGFDEAQTAFGFSATDVGDTFGGSNLILSFGLADGGTKNVTIDNSLAADGNLGGSVLFAGWIDEENPFKTVTFGSSRLINWDGLAFDDFAIGILEEDVAPPAVVPEPSSLLGLLGLGVVMAVGSLVKGKR